MHAFRVANNTDIEHAAKAKARANQKAKRGKIPVFTTRQAARAFRDECAGVSSRTRREILIAEREITLTKQYLVIA